VYHRLKGEILTKANLHLLEHIDSIHFVVNNSLISFSVGVLFKIFDGSVLSLTKFLDTKLGSGGDFPGSVCSASAFSNSVVDDPDSGMPKP